MIETILRSFRDVVPNRIEEYLSYSWVFALLGHMFSGSPHMKKSTTSEFVVTIITGAIWYVYYSIKFAWLERMWND